MQDIQSTEKEALEKLSLVSNPEALETFRIEFLGKKGRVTELMKQLGSLPPEQKAAFGKEANALRQKLELAFQDKRESLTKTKRKALDLTLPGIRPQEGRLHPITQTLRDIVAVFEKLGFETVDGREIETEFH